MTGRTEDETALKGLPYKPKTIEREKKNQCKVVHDSFFLDVIQCWHDIRTQNVLINSGGRDSGALCSVAALTGSRGAHHL